MPITVNTPCGPICGIAAEPAGTRAFLGVRYAEAGRWEYPRAVTHWDGTYDASRYGNCALQQRYWVNEGTGGRPFYYNEFRKGVPFTYGEDCLFLNIYAPENAEKAPVIVYIHGGAFIGGSSSEHPFREPVWPALGAVAVTINYRLGPLGFLALPELAEEAGHSGNYALYDQLAALQWVHGNIAAFGGDPGNVTIMGQSAGAMSVQTLVSSPLAKGLVHRAVLSSGGGRLTWENGGAAAGSFDEFWRGVLADAGARTLAEARALDAKAIFDAFGAKLGENFMKNRAACSFVTDGVALPKDFRAVMDAGEQLDIPYLIGSNRQDMVPVPMHNDVQEWAAMQKQPAYAYLFSRHLPGDEAGSFHSADLWHWFGDLHNSWRPFDARDRELSGQMAAYLVNFARTGDPNGAGLPRWDAGSAEHRVMHFSDEATQMEAVEPQSLGDTASQKGW